MTSPSYTSEQLQLQEYIRGTNAHWQKWAEDHPNYPNKYRPVPDDLDYWAKLGIFSVDQYLLEMEWHQFSRDYQIVTGVRPDRAAWSSEDISTWYTFQPDN